MIYDVIIVGSGISGLTAAIYTSRARLKTVVAAGSIWGAQLMFTTVIENFPGFKNGILGAELMNNIREQAERFGSEIIFQDVTRVDFSHQPFNVVPLVYPFLGLIQERHFALLHDESYQLIRMLS